MSFLESYQLLDSGGYRGSGWLLGDGSAVSEQKDKHRLHAEAKTSGWDWAYLHRNKHGMLCLFENKGRCIHNAKVM
jgi:hypothetical protein